ncbi:fimbrial protein [Paraburkholderia sp. CNPSo 3157]|uniref:Fimbrial protein n=2 Tax=Paraburkholderia franconis TaxID=2654983 RepID=A0A7X1N781_9BURK|nr:fimbrial protein [Paraburkholderia franconis]
MRALLSYLIACFTQRERKASRLALVPCVLIWALLPVGANAATCTPNPSATFSMAFPVTIVVPRDLPVGADIPAPVVQQQVPVDGSVGISCTFTGSETVPAVFTNYQVGSSSGIVTPIGNTGVGYKLHSDTTGSDYVTGTKNLGVAAFAAGPTSCSVAPCHHVMGPVMTMTLVKLQQTLNNPTLPSGKYMDVTIGGYLASTVSLANPIQIVSQTCSVTTSSIDVDLGSVSIRKFTTMGSGSDPVNFSIGVDCTGLTTNLGITFTDAVNPSNQTNTLPLSSTSTASGVGIQILRNGTAVAYGPDSNIAGTTNQIMIGQVNGTATTIPLAARYVQTASSIRGGSANGRATFTMSYQ